MKIVNTGSKHNNRYREIAVVCFGLAKSGFRLPLVRANTQRQPEKAKPFGILPNGFLLDGLVFRLPHIRQSKQPENIFRSTF